MGLLPLRPMAYCWFDLPTITRAVVGVVFGFTQDEIVYAPPCEKLNTLLAVLGELSLK